MGEEKPTETATNGTGAGKPTSDAPDASLPPQGSNTGVGQNDPGVASAIGDRPGKGGVIPPKAHRFQPGQVTNPGGRPKGGGPTDAMRKFSGKTKAQLARVNQETLTLIERSVVQLLIESATKASLRNVEFFAERLDGKVPQATVEISLTPAQAQAMTDDEIRDLLRR